MNIMILSTYIVLSIDIGLVGAVFSSNWVLKIHYIYS